MGFFDLNIPYTESTKRNPTTEKSIRLKLAVKAMELGYTGVAYNRTITGVMSEVDRCSISLFPLSSVLKVSPSISTSVNLHRRLLNVPTSTPFRQYTRLTVVVDTPAQGSALNSGNPVLKTYDIVAVRPLKQDSFDQACKNYEVDIIAIDFSENRFRLKQPLVKAAIERGVYFEITYSNLVLDPQLRRQMISNTKVLVDWTRGKNLIFSSGAPSVTELRGPYDVANLASLLGLSIERAKASVSRTCRSLLENGLRKKKFHKEAIRVELIQSDKEIDIEGGGFDDWLKWDPISSGEGDLQLDDMAKLFAVSSKESKSVKAIDFVSIIDELPSHGLQIMDMVPETKVESHEIEKVQNEKIGDCDTSSKNETLEANCVEVKRLSCDVSLCEEILEEEQMKDMELTEDDVAGTPASLSLPLCNVSLNEDVLEEELSEMVEDVSVAPSSTLVTLRSNDELQSNDVDSVVHEQLEDRSMEVQEEVKDDSQMSHLYAHESSSSDKVGRKQKSSRRSASFPFKRLLKTSHFKKAHKNKTKSTILSLSELIG